MDKNRDTQETGLETVLTRHLRRVEAPEELWHCVQHASHSPIPHSRPRMTLVIAAVLSLAALVWGFHFSRSKTAANRTVVQALAGVPENLEFRSQEALRIQNWVKENTGLNIPLATKSSRSVRLVGARVMKTSTPTAAIAYLVGDRYAMLLVSGSASNLHTSAEHHSLTNERWKDVQVTSWTMHGQSYALASAATGDFHEACGICHI